MSANENSDQNMSDSFFLKKKNQSFSMYSCCYLDFKFRQDILFDIMLINDG